MADTEVREDVEIYPIMVDLAACLCTELEASGLGGACFCGIIPGDQAVLDVCATCEKAGAACPGQAWVRLITGYPSSLFPQPDVQGASCNTPLAYQIEIGVARCFPTGKANNVSGYTPPTMAEQLNATRLQLADMAAMKRAIKCCLSGSHEDLTYVLGAYVPISTGGGCGGGVWQLTVWTA